MTRRRMNKHEIRQSRMKEGREKKGVLSVQSNAYTASAPFPHERSSMRGISDMAKRLLQAHRVKRLFIVCKTI